MDNDLALSNQLMCSKQGTAVFSLTSISVTANSHRHELETIRKRAYANEQASLQLHFAKIINV